ncbi:20915_t:CDS:2, partial [Gigaspora rosea]
EVGVADLPSLGEADLALLIGLSFGSKKASSNASLSSIKMSSSSFRILD